MKNLYTQMVDSENQKSHPFGIAEKRFNWINNYSNGNQEQLPLYEEEVILVNNPEDPNNPIKKRILKRVKTEYDAEEDDYQDLYILDESE